MSTALKEKNHYVFNNLQFLSLCSPTSDLEGSDLNARATQMLGHVMSRIQV